MIEQEINKIVTATDKAFQWKINQLHKIGKSVYDQLNQGEFKNQLSILAPALKNEIEKSQQQVAQIETAIRENEALLKQKEEIEAKLEELKKKHEELAELKEKNNRLNHPENNPAQIQKDISRFIGEQNDLIKKHISTLQNLNVALDTANTDLEKQLASKIKEAEYNLTVIQNKQVDGLHKLNTTPIQSVFVDFGNEVNRLVEEYNYYTDKINSVKIDLEDISQKHDEVVEIFKAHKLENETIFGALHSREGVLNHVNLLCKEIEERLLTFDNEIREIVKKRDQLPIYQLAETKQYQ
jgi:DNA repair exonuclease SbcCD ATPase subunit